MTLELPAPQPNGAGTTVAPGTYTANTYGTTMQRVFAGAYVIGIVPSTSTESTQSPNGPRPYPSPVCCDRTWSSGLVEKLCAAVGCEYTADNLQSVVAHYNKSHERDTERRFPEVPFKTDEIVRKPRKAPNLEELISEHGRRLHAAVERHYEAAATRYDELQEAHDELLGAHAELQARYDALLVKATRWLET